ncbi:MAG: hypothetical protein LUG91_00775 [Ruminococcus sp.]|nr:hypothetical protein [Ruminococcus sp.]
MENEADRIKVLEEKVKALENRLQELSDCKKRISELEKQVQTPISKSLLKRMMIEIIEYEIKTEGSFESAC